MAIYIYIYPIAFGLPATVPLFISRGVGIGDPMFGTLFLLCVLFPSLLCNA